MKQSNHFFAAIDSKILLFAVAGIAVALRLPYLMDDFWLDEIWSLNLAKSIDSISEVVTKLKIDANHMLNTALLYLIDETTSWVNYRVASFVSGVVSVFLVYRIALFFGQHQATIATLLSCVCFPLVLYSSEARGYALSIMFSLAAFITLSSYVSRKKSIVVPLFWGSVILAMLSHFSFAYIYAAYVQWSMYCLWKYRENNQRFFLHFVLLHGVPLVVFALLFFNFILQMGVAGANTSTWTHEINKFVALVYGLPKTAIFTVPYLVFTIAMLAWTTYSLYKKQSDYWPLFVLVIVVNPLLVLLAANYGYPQMRYFLLLLPFLLIALSIFLVALFDKSVTGRIFYGIFLTLYFIGSIILDLTFIKYGRGEYMSAMQYLVAYNAAEKISIGSDHDYRNFALLEYYSRYLPEGKSIRYISQGRLEKNPPDWYITHDLSQSAKVAENVTVASHKYKMAASYYAYDPDVIGWHWHIYKKVD